MGSYLWHAMVSGKDIERVAFSWLSFVEAAQNIANYKLLLHLYKTMQPQHFLFLR